MNKNVHTHLQLRFCVSGGAETANASPDALERAKELGREIARRGAILINGATTGFPYWAAIGAKEQNGFTIGISPAESEEEHVERYNLPLDYMDIIIFSGFGYSGRNLLLTRSSDAVIVASGRIGTLNEFTVAFEDGKPIGVLTGTGGTTELLEHIIEVSGRGKDNPNIVYESDPKALLDKLTELVGAKKNTRF
ncbi:MAG: LOG family protein [Candidatus Ryanbacteria bacterium]|nr:LOG family protein [Candidatus Ryanbacteria bacterium]